MATMTKAERNNFRTRVLTRDAKNGVLFKHKLTEDDLTWKGVNGNTLLHITSRQGHIDAIPARFRIPK
jgi:ankyrin repeat protein